jgi:hypothetical protein
MGSPFGFTGFAGAGRFPEWVRADARKFPLNPVNPGGGGSAERLDTPSTAAILKACKGTD